MNAVPKELLELLRQIFSSWDPFTNPEPDKALFDLIAKLFSADELIVLRQDPADPGKFTREWVVPGTPAGAISWTNSTGSHKTTCFAPSEVFLGKMRKAGPSQIGSVILVDSKHEIDLLWTEMGVFDPATTDVGLMIYPFSLGGRDALLLMMATRKGIPDHESLFKTADRERFTSIGNCVVPCLQAAGAIIESNLASWRKLLKDPHGITRSLLASFLEAIAKREMVGMRKVSFEKGPIDVIVDTMSYFVTNEICKDEPSATADLIGRHEKLLHACDEFMGDLCSGLPEIFITWRFLLGFFLHCFIQHVEKNKNVLCGLSEQETLELYSRLAKAVKFYLLWSNHTRTKNTIYFRGDPRRDYTEEATDYFATIGYLASEYASLVDGVDRRLNIESDLRKMALTQALFYATKERYRDHFLHVLDVCLLGLFLMKAVFPEYSVFSSGVSLRNWLVASLFHDVGYIMELQDMRMTETEFLDFPEIKEFRESISAQVKQAELRFNDQARERFEEAGLRFPASSATKLNHGVVSALHVLDILQRNGDRTPEEASRLVKGHEDTLYAMASHDFSGETLDVFRYPLAVLLRLCDEIQDWDRPRIDVLSFREQILAAVRYGGAFAPDGASMMRHVRITAQGNPFLGKLTLPSTPYGRVPRLSIALDYRKVEDPGFFVIYSWLLKCHKFQGIVLQERPGH